MAGKPPPDKSSDKTNNFSDLTQQGSKFTRKFASRGERSRNSNKCDVGGAILKAESPGTIVLLPTIIQNFESSIGTSNTLVNHSQGAAPSSQILEVTESSNPNANDENQSEVIEMIEEHPVPAQGPALIANVILYEEKPVPAPGPALVADVILKLQKVILLPWLFLPEDNGINVLLLSRDRERVTQRRVYFSFDGKDEELTVHQKTIHEDILKDIFNKGEHPKVIALNKTSEDEFVERILRVVKRLRVYEVCVGVCEAEYKCLWEIDHSGEIDKNIFREARFKETFRHFACRLLVPTDKYFKRRCDVCIATKIRFTSKLPHHKKAEVHPNTPNAHMDRAQLVEKVAKQQKELKYARAQIFRIKSELRKAVDKNGVDVDEELSEDLCKIVEGLTLNPVQELIFKEQIRVAKAKKSSNRRWHPTLIRFALYSRSSSAQTQTSGALPLPSERTMYDFSHILSAKSGCMRGKLDIVCKQLNPETHHTYHVLLIDEMHISKKVVYLKSTGEIVGYIDINDAADEFKCFEAELKGALCTDSPPVAMKILAFMVKGVTSGIHDLVASFRTGDALDAEELYGHTWDVIGALERSDVLIIAIVGTVINRAFYALHIPLTKTASVIFDTLNLCAPSRPIYFFSSHTNLLKLIRNCLYKSGTKPSSSRILTKNGQAIVWKTIVDLFEEDDKLNLEHTHKLSSDNVYLNSQSVMKVSYAAEVLSNSVALDLVARNKPGISETIIFVKKANDFFDQLNGKEHWLPRRGPKKTNPNLEPYQDLNDKRFDDLLEYLDYLNEWKREVEGKQGLTKSQRSKMMLSQEALDGIAMTVHSFIAATRFLLSEGVESLNARVFSLDRLLSSCRKQKECSETAGDDPPPKKAKNG